MGGMDMGVGGGWVEGKRYGGGLVVVLDRGGVG